MDGGSPPHCGPGHDRAALWLIRDYPHQWSEGPCLPRSHVDRGRAARARSTLPVYVAFDVLTLDGKDCARRVASPALRPSPPTSPPGGEPPDRGFVSFVGDPLVLMIGRDSSRPHPRF